MNLEEIIKSEKSIVKYPKKVYFASSSNFITLLWERPEFDLHIINLAINTKLGNADKVSEIKFTNNLNLRNLAYNDNVVDVTYSSNIPTCEFLVQNDDNDTFTCYIANAFWGENSKIYCYGDFSSCFTSCKIMTDYNFISSFDTSNVINMYQMFANNSELLSLDLSNFNTSKVTNMAKMFIWSTKLRALDISSFDTSNVTNMSYMFATIAVNKLILNLNTSKVTDMSGMFYDVSSTLIDISSFDTTNVTNMKNLFKFCEELNRIQIGLNFNTSKVTNMASMFQNTYNLKYVDLSTFDTSKVTDMSNMFSLSRVNLNIFNFSINRAITIEKMFYSINSSRIFCRTFLNNEHLISTDMFLDLNAYFKGGNGTTYDANHIDSEYARIDGENGLPGYFTNPSDAIKITLINVDNEGYTDGIYLCAGDTYSIPTLQGYTAVVTDNNGNTYSDGDTITINQYITLTFVWSANN